ncbi:hypothetical protein H2203_002168 [Taxawa tesnikishii (nom. ined.)]|nr:hypothetical protein H2203_002168 [Dothideales sp. JES 119]
MVRPARLHVTRLPLLNSVLGSLPVFTDTSSPELDHALSTLRSKHFVPAYLNKRQRNLIFKDKFKTELENTPSYATLGEEEIPLEHIDRTRDIPARVPLLQQTVDLMQAPEDWKQLPAILEGLHKAKAAVKTSFLEKTVRKAIQAGQLRTVLACLQKANATGLSLRNERILRLVIWGLHQEAQTESWDQEHLKKALQYANNVAQLLEQAQHGTGRTVLPNDPRTDPAVIGVYLELAAVNAWKYQDKKDTDGSVMKYAERLMSCFENYQPPVQQDVSQRGPQTEMLTKLPVWHGLRLAKAILGRNMPNSQQAQSIVQEYEARLSELADALDNGAAPKPNTYAEQVLGAWNGCISD